MAEKKEHKIVSADTGEQVKPGAAPKPQASPEIKPASIQNLTFHLIHFCFERQWLKACLLRL